MILRQKPLVNGRIQSLDTATIGPMSLQGRHSQTFEGAEFDELCDSIHHESGNLQPILVAPCKDEAQGYKFQLLTGERRLQACRRLGLKVNGIVLDKQSVERLGPAQQALLPLLENLHSQNLCPWELGTKCLALVEARLFKNQVSLARALCKSEGLISEAIAVARLPEEVVSAFARVADIQIRHAQALKRALTKDEAGVLDRAAAVTAQWPTERSAKDVVDFLCGKAQKSSTVEDSERGAKDVVDFPSGKPQEPSAVEAPDSAVTRPLCVDGKQIGHLSVSVSGKVSIEFVAAYELLAVDTHLQMAAAIEQTVAQHLSSETSQKTAPLESRCGAPQAPDVLANSQIASPSNTPPTPDDAQEEGSAGRDVIAMVDAVRKSGVEA